MSNHYSRFHIKHLAQYLSLQPLGMNCTTKMSYNAYKNVPAYQLDLYPHCVFYVGVYRLDRNRDYLYTKLRKETVNLSVSNVKRFNY